MSTTSPTDPRVPGGSTAAVPIDRRLLAGDAPAVAPLLLNALLDVDGCAGRIVEVEAYTADDPASHSARGPTRRNSSMFEIAGTLYVYLIYGMHHCANVVTGPVGDGKAVLVRAIVPVTGAERMRERRGGVDPRRLVDGPGKLCRALGIDQADDGIDLCDPHGRVRLLVDDVPPPRRPLVGPRIGISAAVERPWRWRVPSPRRTT